MKHKLIFGSYLLLQPIFCLANNLPNGFVYLEDINPSILQEIRYAGYHNFIGRPIAGYQSEKCILTRQAAEALNKVQNRLKAVALSLKVYDCYRPQRAVENFIIWSQQASAQQMKAEFYPNINKADFFIKGYVAKKSSHSRGSTVDLTLVSLPIKKQASYKPGQKLTACTAPYSNRFLDNSLDMGTGFDCMDKLSHNDTKDISAAAYRNRRLLQSVLQAEGFQPYFAEWWHFTLTKEPYPNSYFNFPVS